jgi:UDP-glucose 4-epimerase
MHVLVTGGAGFIGANLVRRLDADARFGRVTVLDDLSTGSLANLAGSAARAVEGSILDTDVLGPLVAEADAVVHLAARPSVPRSIADPLASHAANATGTLNVLEAARHAGGRHVIVASSSSVYGANPTLPKHEGLLPMPASPYAVSKLATESYALAYRRCFSLPVLAFRFFNVFGPLQAAGHAYAAVIPAFVDAALRGRPLTVHGDGTQSRDFTYVGTVTEVITEALVRRVDHDGPVNLAFGSRIDLLSVIAKLEGLLGHPVAREHTVNRAGDVPHSQADDIRLRSLFPDVAPVPFDDGLRATVAWMQSIIQ